MSKKLYEGPEMILTQFVGPANEAINGDRRKIQVTLGSGRYFVVSRPEFLRGIRAFVATLTPEERSEVLGLVPR